MANDFKIGDWVEVMDEGLLMLQSMMKQMGVNVKPNNHGRVKEFMNDGTILIEFPIGDEPMDEHSQVAPYPKHKLKKLPDNYKWI